MEHPQDLINRIQFGDFGALCERGGGRVPVRTLVTFNICYH